MSSREKTKELNANVSAIHRQIWTVYIKDIKFTLYVYIYRYPVFISIGLEIKNLMLIICKYSATNIANILCKVFIF